MREKASFTHGRASLNFTFIPMFTSDVAMPCPCGAWQGCAMPLHHSTIGSSRARNLVLPCSQPCAIPHLTPGTLSIPLSFPHRPYPILATFLSTTCVLKRFPLTSPCKLSLTCVKRGFLRTAEPHGTSQLSPCAPLMSHCHVHALPGSDVPCPTPSPRCHRTFATLPAPAPG